MGESRNSLTQEEKDKILKQIKGCLQKTRLSKTKKPIPYEGLKLCKTCPFINNQLEKIVNLQKNLQEIEKNNRLIAKIERKIKKEERKMEKYKMKKNKQIEKVPIQTNAFYLDETSDEENKK